MTEESTGFSQAKARLEEIVSQVRKKDTSLEKSLDLLEEGVRLANRCTELIDQADWDAAAVGAGDDTEAEGPDVATDGLAVNESLSESEASGDDSAQGADDSNGA